MPGRDTQYEKLAREAMERIEGDRAMQEQLSLLPDETGADLKSDRPTRGKGKALSQMREFLASKGYRFPEEVLAQIAGLMHPGKDPLQLAMEEAERVLAWAEAGAAPERLSGGVERKAKATLGQRLNVLSQIRTAQLRAADALMPYGAPKATPDEGGGTVVQVVVAGQSPADRAGQARDVTPKPARLSGRMVPADVAAEIEGNQPLSETQSGNSDAESRTE